MVDIVRFAIAEGLLMSCCISLDIARSCTVGNVKVDSNNSATIIVLGEMTNSGNAVHDGRITDIVSDSYVDLHSTDIIAAHHEG